MIDRSRKVASLRVSNHPWSSMDDFELLKSAGLYSYDYKNNVEGFNLASILLLGKDQVILSILPYHKTDAILRKVNVDRYDDRDDIRTNLIESYDRLFAFVNKHLPDSFYLEGDIRISIRDKIFREVISNILIHRNYSSAYPAKFIIGTDSIFTENANKPHGYGLIDPNNFSPFPKNPTIAKFFKEMGLVDELGSGVRNIHKYGKTYFGFEPKIIEDEIFTVIFKTVENSTTHQVTHQVTNQVDEKVEDLLEYCKEPKSRSELQEFMGIKDRTHFRLKILNPLVEKGIIKLAIPDKPNTAEIL